MSTPGPFLSAFLQETRPINVATERRHALELHLTPIIEEIEYRVLSKAIAMRWPEGTWQWPDYDRWDAPWKRGTHREKCDLLSERVIKRAYARESLKRIERGVRVNPLVIFRSGRDQRVPPECEEKDGRVWNLSDPAWRAVYPPCWRPDCRCLMFAMNRSGINKLIAARDQ